MTRAASTVSFTSTTSGGSSSSDARRREGDSAVSRRPHRARHARGDRCRARGADATPDGRRLGRSAVQRAEGGLLSAHAAGGAARGAARQPDRGRVRRRRGHPRHADVQPRASGFFLFPRTGAKTSGSLLSETPLLRSRWRNFDQKTNHSSRTTHRIDTQRRRNRQGPRRRLRQRGDVRPALHAERLQERAGRERHGDLRHAAADALEYSRRSRSCSSSTATARGSTSPPTSR
jgi:hypothetical protein